MDPDDDDDQLNIDDAVLNDEQEESAILDPTFTEADVVEELPVQHATEDDLQINDSDDAMVDVADVAEVNHTNMEITSTSFDNAPVLGLQDDAIDDAGDLDLDFDVERELERELEELGADDENILAGEDTDVEFDLLGGEGVLDTSVMDDSGKQPDLEKAEEDDEFSLTKMESWNNLMKNVGEKEPMSLPDLDQDDFQESGQVTEIGNAAPETQSQTTLPDNDSVQQSVESMKTTTKLEQKNESNMDKQAFSSLENILSRDYRMESVAFSDLDDEDGLKSAPVGSRVATVSSSMQSVHSMTSSMQREEPFGFGSDDDISLPPELEAEKRKLAQKLRDLDSEFTSEEQLLQKLKSEQQLNSDRLPSAGSDALARRTPKKRMQKPRLIRSTLAGSSSRISEAAPWSSNNEIYSKDRRKSMSVGDLSPPHPSSASTSRDTEAATTVVPVITAPDTDDKQATRPSSVATAASSDNEQIVNPQGDLGSEAATAKKEERNLKIEYQSLQMAIKAEAEKQSKLSMKIETTKSSIALQRRAVRATKMKARELQDRCRQLLHWLQVVAKVAFEKEKDKANALLQRARKIYDRYRNLYEESSALYNTRKAVYDEKFVSYSETITARDQMAEEERILNEELERLRALQDQEVTAFTIRKEQMEQDLITRMQAEEAQRKYEAQILAEACEKQRPGKPVDIDELEAIEAKKKGLSKVSNRFQSLDVSSFEGVRFLSANSNNINSVQGLRRLKDLVSLDLSANPITELDSLGPSEMLQVIDLHSTEVNTSILCMKEYLDELY
ncbi:hypothetical protein HDU76_009463 [Blyttiomyces sp. JEL0837]|nr:hypothetical protein HDU76_009463 [Blyttiomyces sp. JEL0837]